MEGRFSQGVLAGEAAEIVFLGRADPVGSAGDKESAMAMATRIFPRPEEAAAFIAWLGYRAEYVVGLPYNRLRVEALARALIERKEMNARQAREIVESVDPDAIELVRGLSSTVSLRPQLILEPWDDFT